MIAPVILFVYNRPEHTRITLDKLCKNILADNTDLFIFSDGAKSEKEQINVDKVRTIIENATGFKSITILKRTINIGLAASVIAGVSEVISKYGNAVVLEDDIATEPNFLIFMNNALNYYQNNKSVYSVSGYRYPGKIPKSYKYDTLLYPRASSWGWGTWLDRWENVDWSISDYHSFKNDKKAICDFNSGGKDMATMLELQMQGKIDSWAIRWCYHHYKHRGCCVLPVKIVLNNTGLDGSGIHCIKSNASFKDLEVSDKTEWIFTDKENKKIIRTLAAHFSQSKLRKMIKKIIYPLVFIKRFMKGFKYENKKND